MRSQIHTWIERQPIFVALFQWQLFLQLYLTLEDLYAKVTLGHSHHLMQLLQEHFLHFLRDLLELLLPKKHYLNQSQEKQNFKLINHFYITNKIKVRNHNYLIFCEDRHVSAGIINLKENFSSTCSPHFIYTASV